MMRLINNKIVKPVSILMALTFVVLPLNSAEAQFTSSITRSAVVNEVLSNSSSNGDAVGVPVHVVRDTSEVGEQTAYNTSLTAHNTGSLLEKEMMDAVAYNTAKMFLRTMTTSIINWINSGFSGNPAFVTDLNGFMVDVADETVGDFIYNDPALDNLCSPFELDVKIALATQYNEERPGNYDPQCTLDETTDNMEGFLAGDFSQGGWQAWFEMTQNPQNNPIGAYLSAQREVEERIERTQEEEMTRLDFGNGFFSMEICENAEGQASSIQNCVIGTPGSVIADQINTALNAGRDELLSADEVNEVFNTLFAQLAEQTITGSFGLIGLGGNNGYNNGTQNQNFNNNSLAANYNNDLLNTIKGEVGTSFLQAVLEADDAIRLDTSLYQDSSAITEASQNSQDYINLQSVVAQLITEVSDYYDDAASGCNLSVSFPSSLEEVLSEAEEEILYAINVMSILNTLEEVFNNGDNMDIQVQALDEFKNLNATGLFHSSSDNTELALYIQYELMPDIEKLYEDIDEAAAQCN